MARKPCQRAVIAEDGRKLRAWHRLAFLLGTGCMPAEFLADGMRAAMRGLRICRLVIRDRSAVSGKFRRRAGLRRLAGGLRRRGCRSPAGVVRAVVRQVVIVAAVEALAHRGASLARALLRGVTHPAVTPSPRAL